MKNHKTVKYTTNPNNVEYTLLGTIRKYIFPILGICGLIIGNIICYNVNGRLLMTTTNLIGGFMIILAYIKCRV